MEASVMKVLLAVLLLFWNRVGCCVTATWALSLTFWMSLNKMLNPPQVVTHAIVILRSPMFVLHTCSRTALTLRSTAHELYWESDVVVNHCTQNVPCVFDTTLYSRIGTFVSRLEPSSDIVSWLSKSVGETIMNERDIDQLHAMFVNISHSPSFSLAVIKICCLIISRPMASAQHGFLLFKHGMWFLLTDRLCGVGSCARPSGSLHALWAWLHELAGVPQPDLKHDHNLLQLVLHLLRDPVSPGGGHGCCDGGQRAYNSCLRDCIDPGQLAPCSWVSWTQPTGTPRTHHLYLVAEDSLATQSVTLPNQSEFGKVLMWWCTKHFDLHKTATHSELIPQHTLNWCESSTCNAACSSGSFGLLSTPAASAAAHTSSIFVCTQ